MDTKPVEISKRLLLINSASGVVVRILSISVLVWLQQFLLKRISTDEYSLYPLLASLMVFFPLLTSVLTSGLSRFVVDAYAKSDNARVTEISSTMFCLLLFICLPMLALGFLFSWYVGDILTISPKYLSDARLMMSFMVFSFVVNSLFTPFQVGFDVRQKYVLLNGLNLLKELFRIAILFLLLSFLNTRVLWVVISTVSANIFFMFIMVIYSRRLIPALKFRYSSINWKIAKEVSSFGGWSFIGQIAELIRLNSDPIVLNKLGTSLDVTCFHLGSLPMRHIGYFTSVIRQPLIPQLTALHSNNRADVLRGAFLRGNRYALWGALFLATPLMVLSNEFVSIWVGNEFAAASGVVILLLGTFPFLYSNLIMSNIAVAKAEIRSLSIRGAFIQILNLALSIYLVGYHHLGAFGSALATFMTTAFIYPLATYSLGLRLAEVSFTRWFWESIFPGLLPASISSIFLFIIKLIFAPSSLLSIIVCTGLFSLCYFAVLYFFALQPKDRNDLLAIKNKLFSLSSTEG